MRAGFLNGARERKKAVKEERGARVDRDTREVENTQRLLVKLPKKVWEKILDHLDRNDLFPLALSCRYFRHKQKELVARKTRQGGKPCMILKTNLTQKLKMGQLASAEYVRFCSKEKTSRDEDDERATDVKMLAAFHGHLPLLQELLADSGNLDYLVTHCAGGSSSSQSLHLLLVPASDFTFAFSSSQRKEDNWRPCSGCQPWRNFSSRGISLPQLATVVTWR